jgi:hypothetical protein
MLYARARLIRALEPHDQAGMTTGRKKGASAIMMMKADQRLTPWLPGRPQRRESQRPLPQEKMRTSR